MPKKCGQSLDRIMFKKCINRSHFSLFELLPKRNIKYTFYVTHFITQFGKYLHIGIIGSIEQFQFNYLITNFDNLME